MQIPEEKDIIFTRYENVTSGTEVDLIWESDEVVKFRLVGTDIEQYLTVTQFEQNYNPVTEKL